MIDYLWLFGPVDFAALAVLLSGWIGLTLAVEHAPASRPSTAQLMAQYRRDWMKVFVTREPRIFDSQIIGNLRQGTAFFTSASIIAIGGGFALLGNADLLRGLARDLTAQDAPTVVWEIKLVLLLGFAINAFLKFVWSHRLFGYAAVIMAAVPNDVAPEAYERAAQAAEINITAARSYNRGLRSIYFGIAASAWLLGPLALLAAAIFTIAVIFRREFASRSREVLLRSGANPSS